MLYQIATFLLDVLAGLFSGACLLRLYMQRLRVPFGNPLGALVFALTDWLVLPLRRVLPPLRAIDLASLGGAMLLQLLQYGVLLLLRLSLLPAPLFAASPPWAWLPWLALLGLLRVAVSGLIVLVIFHAVLSWVQQGRSLLADLLARLCAPLLRPLRRMVPLVGGIDLSPLAALVLLQIVMIVLGHLQAAALR